MTTDTLDRPFASCSDAELAEELATYQAELDRADNDTHRAFIAGDLTLVNEEIARRAA